MAAKYGKLPSEVLRLTRRKDEWLAYQLDPATAFLGLWVEVKLGETEKRGKKLVQKHRLDKLLADPASAPRPAQFRSTAGMLGKKL